MVAEGGGLFLTSPKWGGGRGSIPALRSSRFSRHPLLRQAPTKRFANLKVWGKRPQAPGGLGPKPWGPGPQAPWRPGPQAPGAWIPPLSPIASQTDGSGSQNLGCYHNPQSADLGGRWIQSHERRGSLQHFGRWAGPQSIPAA